jgi:hypothetical protein
MSYDLAVWRADRPITTEEAEGVYQRLCDGEHGAVPRCSGIKSFLSALVDDNPDLDDANVDDSPWSAPLDHSKGHVVMCLVPSAVDDLLPEIEALAERFDLVLYDPQRSIVLYPPRLAAMPHLRLLLEDDTCYDNPTARQIQKGLKSLNDDNTFAILERTDAEYIQTLLDGAEYVVEYRAGGPDQHFQAFADDVAEVVRVFQAYAKGDDAWKQAFDWTRIDV